MQPRGQARCVCSQEGIHVLNANDSKLKDGQGYLCRARPPRLQWLSSAVGSGQGQATAGLWLAPGSRAAAAGSARAGGPWGKDTSGRVQLLELTGTKTQGRPQAHSDRRSRFLALCTVRMRVRGSCSGLPAAAAARRRGGRRGPSGPVLFCGCGSWKAVRTSPPQPHLLRGVRTGQQLAQGVVLSTRSHQPPVHLLGLDWMEALLAHSEARTRPPRR